MKMWEILVPCVVEGARVKKEYHREWDAKVRKVSKGLTIHGSARGQWVHSQTGELIVERMIPVRFTASESSMIMIAQMTREHYNQHTVLVYKVSDEVHFIGPHR